MFASVLNVFFNTFQLYTKHSSEAAKMFEGDPKSFEVYHNGYQAQLKKWDVNPLQIILTWIKKR